MSISTPSDTMSIERSKWKTVIASDLDSIPKSTLDSCLFIHDADDGWILDLTTNWVWIHPDALPKLPDAHIRLPNLSWPIGDINAWKYSTNDNTSKDKLKEFFKRIWETPLNLKFFSLGTLSYVSYQDGSYGYAHSRGTLPYKDSGSTSRYNSDWQSYPHSEQLVSLLAGKSKKAIVQFLCKDRPFNIKDDVITFSSSSSSSANSWNVELTNVLTKAESHLMGLDWTPNFLDKDGLWELHSLLVKNTPKHIERISVDGFARDPQKDVVKDGFVCIDFGTSSTVAAYASKGGKNMLRLSNAAEQKVGGQKYENPTMLYFAMPSFFDVWNEQTHRPWLSRDQLSVGQVAKNHFQNRKNIDNPDKLKAFYQDLKQSVITEIASSILVGDQEIEVTTATDPRVNLAPFASKKLNTLELYAYLLGMRINTREQLFTKYYMTFPVKYTREQKDIILAAFKRGLLRSLPATLVYQPDFSITVTDVVGGVEMNEPTSFAIEALSQYLEDPEDEDVTTPFAIFDFGGGTTDFTFGAYTQYVDEDDNDGYYNTLEYFGCSGDPKLGGENILWKLAETVFLDNIETMIEQVIPFEGTSELIKPEGSERLFGPSYKARTNKTILMETLRNFWEERADNETLAEGIAEESSTEEPSRQANPKIQNAIVKRILENSEVFHPNLAQAMMEAETTSEDQYLQLADDTDGNRKPVDLINMKGELCSISIHYDYDALERVLQKVLENGLRNFLAGMESAFRLHSFEGKTGDVPEQALVVLAGNGSRSQRVKKLFSRLNDTSTVLGALKEQLLPQCGFELLDTTVEQTQRQDSTFSCKTGVALGMLRLLHSDTEMECKLVSKQPAEEAGLSYYVGYQKRKTLKVAIEKGAAIAGEWISGISLPSTNQSKGKKTIYATSQDRAKTGMPFSECEFAHRCNFIDFVDETLAKNSAAAFELQLRVVSRDTIEARAVEKGTQNASQPETIRITIQ